MTTNSTLVKGMISKGPMRVAISSPFHKAVVAPRACPLPRPRSGKVPELTPATHHPRLMYF